MLRSVALLVAAGAHRGLTLVPDRANQQVARNGRGAAALPGSKGLTQRPMRLIFQRFLNFVNYFLLFRRYA
jgi:hypothetical protein